MASSDIQIRAVRQDSNQFVLEKVGKSMFLNCPGRDCAAIAVKVLTERQPLVGKSVCFCCKPSWVPIEVMVDGRTESLLIKVAEVAKKWGVAEPFVRQKCDDGDFGDLIPKPLNFASAASTVCTTPDLKEEASPTLWESPSFFQFVRFLQEPRNSDNYTQILLDLKNSWPRLQEKIQKELPFWKRKCQRQGLSNFPVGDRDFPLEYFSADHSVWLHIKLDTKRFVINLSTGEFCRFKVIVRKKCIPAFQRIEKLRRYIGSVRISEFQLKEAVNYRIYTPYFSVPLDQALKAGMSTSANRERYVSEWTIGLKALHKAGILHGDISSALVLEGSPNLEVQRAVIGGFKSPLILEEAGREALLAEEFSLFEKCLKELL